MNNNILHTIIHSDVYAGLTALDDNSIDVAVTSPPYWSQRDYGFDGQIGNEEKYQDYIDKLVTIFNQLKNKISTEGVFFLNIGDKYGSKYGRTPLLLIPYQLAYLMVQNGWYLNDILIWFKPNHMPSSVKNRFTNSYEPIFVFSKSTNNIYKTNHSSFFSNSKILKVSLQSTPFKHVAVYPEKLVEEIFKKVKIDNNTIFLDPFAGSGTTLKVAKQLFPHNKTFMIECNKDYIEIIKKRCNLNGNYKIQDVNFINYSVNKQNYNHSQNSDLLFNHNIEKISNSCLKIFHNKKDYFNFINNAFNNFNNNKANYKSIYFVGIKDYDIDLINYTSKLNDKGWIIRNLIVVEEENGWFPIFFIVNDNKMSNYTFNYKNLNLKSKNECPRNWNETDFVGYEVNDTFEQRNGKVIKVLEKRENGFPRYILVRWNEDFVTKEFVVFSDEKVNSNLYFDNGLIQEIKEFTYIDNRIEFDLEELNIELNENNGKKINYNGKFKDEKRVNWGASPGARASVDSEFFSLQRLYDVDQNIVADYINKQRLKKGLTKNDLTNLFPKEYKHTVGHWLRKDLGGSLPSIKDWFLLSNFLEIEVWMTNYVCKRALKLQTVKNGEFKLPRDFIQYSFINELNKLYD